MNVRTQACLDNALSLCVRFLQAWDFNKAGSVAPQEFDILVASHLSAAAENLPMVLANLTASLRDGGFLLLQEITGPLGALLFGLEAKAWSQNDGREFGPCTSIAHWRQLLQDSGLHEITIAKYAPLKPTLTVFSHQCISRVWVPAALASSTLPARLFVLQQYGSIRCVFHVMH